MSLLRHILSAPRRALAFVALTCLGLLAFGMYLQHVQGLEPCPMCIVQRYALVGVMICAALGSLGSRAVWRSIWGGMAAIIAAFGAFVAARQSWLQWYPPEFASCGRDFYGMIENYPISRAVPMIFRGSGDCTAVDWTFLGGTIANWSFLWFAGLVVVLLLLLLSERLAKVCAMRALAKA